MKHLFIQLARPDYPLETIAEFKIPLMPNVNAAKSIWVNIEIREETPSLKKHLVLLLQELPPWEDA